MDSQTVVVFVLVTILAFSLALRQTPTSDAEHRGQGSAALRLGRVPYGG
jgi:hypothetical protein